VCNPAPAADVPAELLATASVVVPNEAEIHALTGIAADTDGQATVAARALHKQTGQAVVLTRGGLGALVVSEDVRLSIPPHAVDVVDTVGAGDAFCAALAVRLGEGAGLDEAARFANAAGALATTRRGAEPSMPARDAVEALLRA
jgi:ribokinase